MKGGKLLTAEPLTYSLGGLLPMLLSILSRQSYAKYGIKIPKSTWCHNWKARAVAVQFPAKQFLERKRGFSLVLSRSLASCYNSSGRENGPNWALLLLLYRLSSISTWYSTFCMYNNFHPNLQPKAQWYSKFKNNSKIQFFQKKVFKRFTFLAILHKYT